VTIKFAGREIPKSPYVVLVEGHAGDPSKVTASGPGLQPEGIIISRPTYFDIFTKGKYKRITNDCIKNK
jgi:filamin